MLTKSQIKKEKYPIVKLYSLINKITYTDSILKSNFLEEGNFPIISQERDFINGYSNDDKNIFNIKKPVVVFGDHTKCIKYIDFDFILGADGVKILEPNDKLFTKYLYYFLLSLNIRDLGYARHFRLIKDLNIILPPLQKQKEIVEMLDKVLGNLEKMKKNTEKNIKNSKEIFESELNAIFKKKGKDWEERRLGDIFKTTSGGTPLKSKKEYYTKGIIPWLRSGEINSDIINSSELFITESGLKNSSAKIFPKNSILIALYGATAGQVGILNFESSTNQAICGIFPNEKYLPFFILYLLKYKNEDIVKQAYGSAQPNLSQDIVRQILIPNINIESQKEIVSRLDALKEKTKKMEENYKKVLMDIDEMKKKVLKEIFEN